MALSQVAKYPVYWPTLKRASEPVAPFTNMV